MDIESLLRLLNERGVDYIVIGATAFPVHGYARATVDVDLFIRPERTNAEKTLGALKQFGYDTSDLSADDLLQNKVLIRQYLVETDIHPFVAGVEFDEVWSGRVSGKYGDVPVQYASLDDLIKMKSAAGRPKDIEDLRALMEIRTRKGG